METILLAIAGVVLVMTAVSGDEFYKPIFNSWAERQKSLSTHQPSLFSYHYDNNGDGHKYREENIKPLTNHPLLIWFK